MKKYFDEIMVDNEEINDEKLQNYLVTQYSNLPFKDHKYLKEIFECIYPMCSQTQQRRIFVENFKYRWLYAQE